MKLKPGMTANVSIIVTHRPDVLRINNGALRVRVPQELLPKAAEVPSAKGGKAGESKAPAGGGTVAMTDEERMRATIEVMRAVGWERGSPPTAEQVEKVKALAKEKGLDPDLVAARMSMPAGRKRGEGGGGGGFSGRGGGGGGGGGGAAGGGLNTTIVTRTLYRIPNPDALEKTIEPISVKLGISDGFNTEVLDGLKEGDVVVTNITMPGAVAPMTGQPSSGMQNPFQSSGRGPPSSSGMRGR
jgi:HlyD family secretion protein